MENILPVFLGILILIAIVSLIVFLIRIPIIIAKSRGITGDELNTITLLSWVSILVGITWLVALILSLIWKPNNWLDKDTKKQEMQASSLENSNQLLRYERLEKLNELKEKGILSEEEFQAEKQKIIQLF